MASALQRLFRKKILKQQQQHQDRQAHHDRPYNPSHANLSQSTGLTRSYDTSNYLTVSSLNSPSAISVQKGGVTTNTGAAAASQVELSRVNSPDASSDHGHLRARSASMGASAMLRDLSSGARSWRSSIMSDTQSIVAVDQFGSIMRSDSTSGRHSERRGGGSASITSHDEEEDELEDNQLYVGLLERLDSEKAWSPVQVLLVPSRKAQADVNPQLLRQESYLAMHALAPSNLFKDQFDAISVAAPPLTGVPDVWTRFHLTVTLNPESRSAHVVIARTGGLHARGDRTERKLSVLSESTMYRSMRARQPASDNSATPRKERIRIRILVVSELVVPAMLGSRRISKSPSSIASSKATTTMHGKPKETDDDIDHASSVTFPTRDPTNLGAEQDTCIVPASRHFFADYAFLLDPPGAAGPLQGPLRTTLATLERAAADFANAYVYVPGFDAYNVSRIRRGILARAWYAFEEARKANGDADHHVDLAIWLGADGRSRLLLLLENVVMGHCHGKVYGSICMIRRDADEAFDAVIASYHDHGVNPIDFGFAGKRRTQAGAHSYELAEACVACMGEPEEDLEYILMDKNLATIRSMAANGQLPTRADGAAAEMVNGWGVQRSRNRVRTPLDVLEVMHATLEAIAKAASPTLRASARTEDMALSTMGADDLLPLLAYVLVRSAPRKLASLMYYVRLFGLSDATSPRHNWALVTFEAVVKYLENDPLDLLVESDGHRHGRSSSSIRLQSTPSVRSARSSLRSPSPSPCVRLSAHPADNYSPISASYDKSQGSLASDREQSERVRRASLPSSVLMAAAAASAGSASVRSAKQNVSTSSVYRLDSPSAIEEDGDTTLQPFKRPGAPASASTGKGGRPAMATWYTDMGPVENAASSDGYRSRSSSMHKRASSMTGDLMIRPQIVVRPPMRPRDTRSTILDRTLTSKEGSNSSSRATSPDSLYLASSPPRTVLESRRRSVDSWTMLGMLGGVGEHKQTSVPKNVANSTDAKRFAEGSNLNGMDEARLQSNAGFTIASTSSTGWLPSWASDWGAAGSGSVGRRASNAGALERTHSSSTDHSRHDPDRANEGVRPIMSFPIILPRTNSYHSTSALGFPGLDSMPLFEAHDNSGASAAEAGAETMTSSPHEQASLLSSPSSTVSYSTTLFDHGTIKNRRGSWYASMAAETSISSQGSSSTGAVQGSRNDRRISKGRARLLSATGPGEALPPRLTSDAVSAMPTKSITSATGSGDTFSQDASPISVRPRPVTSASAESVATAVSSYGAAPVLSHRSKSSYDTSEDVAHHMIAPFSSPPSHLLSKLHIPSPVEERSDPIAAPLPTRSDGK